MYFPFNLLFNLYSSHFSLESMPQNAGRSIEIAQVTSFPPVLLVYLTFLEVTCATHLCLQESRMNYLQLRVGRARGVQRRSCRGAITILLILGLTTHLQMRLT